MFYLSVELHISAFYVWMCWSWRVTQFLLVYNYIMQVGTIIQDVSMKFKLAEHGQVLPTKNTMPPNIECPRRPSSQWYDKRTSFSLIFTTNDCPLASTPRISMGYCWRHISRASRHQFTIVVRVLAEYLRIISS